MGNPLQTVRELADILNETELSEIEYEQDKVRIKVVKLAKVQSVQQAEVTQVCQVASPVLQGSLQAPVAEDNFDNCPGLVRSPMVGIAYLSPSPAAAPFVSVGDRVEKGQTLLIIEAMKVLNMIKAPVDGVVQSFFVKNEEPVEYDQRLVVIA